MKGRPEGDVPRLSRSPVVGHHEAPGGATHTHPHGLYVTFTLLSITEPCKPEA